MSGRSTWKLQVHVQGSRPNSVYRETRNKSGVGGKEKCDNPRMGMGGNAAKTVLLGVPVGGASLGE